MNPQKILDRPSWIFGQASCLMKCSRRLSSGSGRPLPVSRDTKNHNEIKLVMDIVLFAFAMGRIQGAKVLPGGLWLSG